MVEARQSNVLQVFPSARWAFGHRILIAVSTEMGLSDPPFPQLAARSRPDTRQGDYVAGVAAALDQAGLDPAKTRTATVFTVRDREDVVGPTQRLMDDTSSRPHPVRNVRIDTTYATGSRFALLRGEVRLDNYRRRDGRGPVDFSGRTRKDQWVPFRLMLPRSASSRPAPVVIYTHGLLGNQDEAAGTESSNAELGLATIAIDWPQHGRRAREDGGDLVTLAAGGSSKLGTLGGMFSQTTIDMTGLYRAIGELQIDVMSPPTPSNPSGAGPDGRSDLRTGSISMRGTSLGGVFGANFAALSPRLDVILFEVAGVGIQHILARGLIWDGFQLVFPRGRSGTEETLLMAALQQVVDPGDGINTADYIRTPRPGQTKKPFMLLTGKGDSIVPNQGSTALARLVDLPLVGPQLFSMPGVRRADRADADGYELRQYRAPAKVKGFPPLGPIPGLPLVGETEAHGAQSRPEAREAERQFLTTFGPTP
jgi:hypothetical protein